MCCPPLNKMGEGVPRSGGGEGAWIVFTVGVKRVPLKAKCKMQNAHWAALRRAARVWRPSVLFPVLSTPQFTDIVTWRGAICGFLSMYQKTRGDTMWVMREVSNTGNSTPLSVTPT